jgi:MerR family transcriptional regulator/heat shock protein HspR
MARKRSEIQPISPDMPVYPIGVAARLHNVHPRTLRIYEKEGLVKPAIIGKRRMFSANDIQWISCIRKLIHDDGISIQGLKKLLDFAPCWEIAGCPEEVYAKCGAAVDRCLPRTLHAAGDDAAAKRAKQADVEKRKKTAQKKTVENSIDCST